MLSGSNGPTILYQKNKKGLTEIFKSYNGKTEILEKFTPFENL